jgi:hypothetical protein
MRRAATDMNERPRSQPSLLAVRRTAATAKRCAGLKLFCIGSIRQSDTRHWRTFATISSTLISSSGSSFDSFSRGRLPDCLRGGSNLHMVNRSSVGFGNVSMIVSRIVVIAASTEIAASAAFHCDAAHVMASFSAFFSLWPSNRLPYSLLYSKCVTTTQHMRAIKRTTSVRRIFFCASVRPTPVPFCTTAPIARITSVTLR